MGGEVVKYVDDRDYFEKGIEDDCGWGGNSFGAGGGRSRQ